MIDFFQWIEESVNNQLSSQPQLGFVVKPRRLGIRIWKKVEIRQLCVTASVLRGAPGLSTASTQGCFLVIRNQCKDGMFREQQMYSQQGFLYHDPSSNPAHLTFYKIFYQGKLRARFACELLTNLACCLTLIPWLHLKHCSDEKDPVVADQVNQGNKSPKF